MTNECNLGVKWTSEQIESVTKALADLRLLVDLELAPRYPHFNHKPYPLGRCKEIRDAVFTLIQKNYHKPLSLDLRLFGIDWQVATH